MKRFRIASVLFLVYHSFFARPEMRYSHVIHVLQMHEEGGLKES